MSHAQVAAVWGEDGWLTSSIDNVMSEFLQLAAFVGLTTMLIALGLRSAKLATSG